jgi:hypothetical protein
LKEADPKEPTDYERVQKYYQKKSEAEAQTTRRSLGVQSKRPETEQGKRQSPEL